MFNKPAGCITAVRDERHKTVMDYFPPEKRNSLFPVGRLDMDTEGFLIITDDGMLSYNLMMPEKKREKTYFLWAKGIIDDEKISSIVSGVKIYDKSEALTAPAKFSLIERSVISKIKPKLSENDLKTAYRKPDLPVFSAYLTITEGKKHQVKRMMKSIGCPVIYLKRVSIGGVQLDSGLPLGSYRSLTDEELAVLRNEEH